MTKIGHDDELVKSHFRDPMPAHGVRSCGILSHHWPAPFSRRGESVAKSSVQVVRDELA